MVTVHVLYHRFTIWPCVSGVSWFEFIGIKLLFCHQRYSQYVSLSFLYQVQGFIAPPQAYTRRPTECGTCGKNFSNPSNAKRHMKTCGVPKDQLQDSCATCGKRFTRAAYKQQHEKKCFKCRKCSKVFNNPVRGVNHEKACKPPSYNCRRCDAVFDNVEDFREHNHDAPQNGNPQPVPDQPRSVKRARETARDDNQGPYRCRTCGERMADRAELYRHRMLRHSDNVPLKEVPWNQGEAPWEARAGDEALQREYLNNRPHILRPDQLGQVTAQYNCPTNDFSGGMTEILQIIRDIILQEQRAFKLNIALGFIMRNVSTGEYRYFIPYANKPLLDRNVTISSMKDFQKLKAELQRSDITNNANLSRPNSSWKIDFVTNMVVYVYRSSYTMGWGRLPEYIKNNPNIVALDNNRGREYEDHLCAFRCLAVHHKQNQREAAVKEYYGRWQAFMAGRGKNLPENPKEYPGLPSTQIHLYERCFEVSVTACELKEDGAVVITHHPTTHFRDHMYLNIHDNHLSYISSFKAYAKKFQCSKCQRHFDRINNLKRHMKTCRHVTKYKLPGGFYQATRTVFDRLEDVGITTAPADRFFPWFATYDFEALLEKVEDGEGSAKLTWETKHRPISVSLASNVEGFTDPVCFVEEDVDTLLSSMVNHLKAISRKSQQLASDKWRQVSEKLQELLEAWKPEESRAEGEENDPEDGAMETDWNEPATRNFQRRIAQPNVFRQMLQRLEENDDQLRVAYNDYDSMDEDDNDGASDSTPEDDTRTEKMQTAKTLMYRRLQTLQSQFQWYLSQLPVVGFNSARYDLNLIKSELAKHLNLSEKAFVVKRNNSYLCVATDQLRFLDMSQFLAPGSSYSKFLKAFRVEENKSYLPYEWLDSVDKLKEPFLPTYDAFYSSLKNVNTLEAEHAAWQEGGRVGAEPKTGQENYEDLLKIWIDRGMTTFRDFLEFYNNLDVGPFVTAVTRFQEFYKENHLDVFKVAISAPGLARQLLFRCAESEGAVFPLFHKEDEDLYRTVKTGICGGPSIVFKRHHKVGETRLRGNPDKVCGSIAGYDANALYLWAIGQPMPTTSYGVITSNKDVLRVDTVRRETYLKMFEWMDWVAKRDGISIRHKLNTGSEKKVGPYFLDGYCAANNTAFEYQGCYAHGHDPDVCPITAKIQNQKWKARQPQLLRRTQLRAAYIKDQGFNLVEKWECCYNRQEQLAASLEGVAHTDYLPPFCKRRQDRDITSTDILEAVKNEEFFGMVECDIEVPETWPAGCEKQMSPREYFSEMSPIFCNTYVKMEDMSPSMREHVREEGLSEKPRQLLVGGMKAEKIFLASPLLRWYLTHGLVVTRIYKALEYVPKACFKPFTDQVSQARRNGDADADTAIIAETMKLLGNSAYGKHVLKYILF